MPKAMRIALFFFAFTVLLAVLIPQFIGTFLGQGDQVTRQLREGADPTVVLEETASGAPLSECPGTDFEYRVSAGGEPYVRALDGIYLAVLIDNKAELFRLEQAGDSAVPLSGSEASAAGLPELLDACVASGVTPQPSSLKLVRQ